MYKFLGLSSVVCLLGISLAFDVNHLPKTLEQLRVFEDKINESVECVRQTLSDGIPDKGLPSFNPLIIDNFTLYLDDFNLPNISGFATLDNGVAENIVNFVVSNIKGTFVLIPPTYTVDFTMLNGNLSNLGHYRTNMTIFDTPIYGEGKIFVGIEGLNITGHVKAVIENGKVDLKEIAAPASIDKFNFNLTGLFNDDEYSANISKIISEKVPEIINNNPDLFIEIVGPILVAVFNALVNDEIGYGIIKQMVQTCIIDVIFPPS